MLYYFVYDTVICLDVYYYNVKMVFLNMDIIVLILNIDSVF